MRFWRSFQILLSLLALTSLACSISIPWLDTPSSPEISSVTVSPHSGSGPIFSPTSLDHFATLEVTATSSQPVPLVIAADGSASAQGTADWTYTCTVPGSHDAGYPQCGDYRTTPDQPTSFNEAGALDWTMIFAP